MVSDGRPIDMTDIPEDDRGYYYSGRKNHRTPNDPARFIGTIAAANKKGCGESSF